jgi:hypothetical protein
VRAAGYAAKYLLRFFATTLAPVFLNLADIDGFQLFR